MPTDLTKKLADSLKGNFIKTGKGVYIEISSVKVNYKNCLSLDGERYSSEGKPERRTFRRYVPSPTDQIFSKEEVPWENKQLPLDLI